MTSSLQFFHFAASLDSGKSAARHINALAGGVTPMHAAAMAGSLPCAAVLLKHGECFVCRNGCTLSVQRKLQWPGACHVPPCFWSMVSVLCVEMVAHSLYRESCNGRETAMCRRAFEAW